MRRLLTAIGAALILFLLLAPSAIKGQSSGKIIGRVTDSSTGGPLIGANVLVDGTLLGGASDQEGRYLILKVPPGRYQLTATYIGHQRMVVTDVQVLTDLTTEVNFRLGPDVLTAGEEVVVTAERPLVRKDLTSMESRVDSDQLERMPVETLSDVLDMQPGITRDAEGNIHIRGGRSSEVAYLVNGISITDDFYKSQALTIENEAIQELQVISGAFNAEYGNAMSGVINIITKSGNNDFHATVKAESGNYVSARDDLFYNINAVSPGAISSISGSLSGPIIENRLTFFITGRQYENSGWLYGENRFLPQGTQLTVVDGDTVLVVGDSSAVPMNDWQTNTGQAAINWQVLPTLTLKLDFISSQSTGRGYTHSFRHNPYGYGYSDNNGRAVLGILTHQISEKTYHSASLAQKRNSSSSALYDDPADPRYTHPDSLIFPANTFATVGTDLSFFERSTGSLIAKWDLTSQVSWSHQIKTGVEYQSDEIRFENYTLIPEKNDNGQEIEPFQPVIVPISQLNHNRYLRSPEKLSVYLQDKIEYESVVINVGLRYDLFDPHGQLPADPEDPNIYQPFKLEHKYHDLDNSGAIDLAEQVPENEYSLEERQSFWYRSTERKSQLSPRFGIAYPITDRGVVHFSYGIFQQIPEYNLLYGGDERKLSEGAGTYGPFGDPDLKPQRTTMYELGLSQQLTENLAVNITGFHRDIRDWISAGAPVPTKVAGVSYVTYVNRDFANVRGFTVMLDRRLSDGFSLNGDYTLQIVEGTNSAPEEEFFSQLDGAEPTKLLIPLGWDQRHTLHINLFYRAGQFGATLLARYSSGQPYTPEILTGERTGRSIITGLSRNSRRKPALLTLDLKAFWNVEIFGTDLQLFGQVYNLLDQDNPLSVFNDSGQPDYTLRQDQAVEADEGFFLRPDFYAAPRRIMLGISYRR